MFELVECEDVVRIPPEKFGLNLKTVALEELSKKYEGMLSKDLGYVIAVFLLRFHLQEKFYLGMERPIIKQSLHF